MGDLMTAFYLLLCCVNFIHKQVSALRQKLTGKCLSLFEKIITFYYIPQVLWVLWLVAIVVCILQYQPGGPLNFMVCFPAWFNIVNISLTPFHTVSYGTLFFPLQFMGLMLCVWAIIWRGKKTVHKLKYKSQTQL